MHPSRRRLFGPLPVVCTMYTLAACGSQRSSSSLSGLSTIRSAPAPVTTAHRPAAGSGPTATGPATAPAKDLLAIPVSRPNGGWVPDVSHGRLLKFPLAQHVLTLAAVHEGQARGLAYAVAPALEGQAACQLLTVDKGADNPSRDGRGGARARHLAATHERRRTTTVIARTPAPVVRIATFTKSVTAPATSVAARVTVGAIYVGMQRDDLNVQTVQWQPLR